MPIRKTQQSEPRTPWKRIQNIYLIGSSLSFVRNIEMTATHHYGKESNAILLNPGQVSRLPKQKSLDVSPSWEGSFRSVEKVNSMFQTRRDWTKQHF
jgi:hypothetical protein